MDGKDDELGQDGDEDEDGEKRGAANVRERRRMCGINVAFLV